MYDFSLFGAIRFTSAVAAKFHVVQTDVSSPSIYAFGQSSGFVHDEYANCDTAVRRKFFDVGILSYEDEILHKFVLCLILR